MSSSTLPLPPPPFPPTPTPGKKSKTQERLESLRREKEAAETSECTFQPRINARSDRLMAERTEALRARSLTAHQQLFQDAVRRQAK
jgi:hypothetical protein